MNRYLASARARLAAVRWRLVVALSCVAAGTAAFVYGTWLAWAPAAWGLGGLLLIAYGLLSVDVGRRAR